ncbi:uncharacterized protein BDV14DRAFT_119737 [Aspergillus stella-maris]|uniref:uncharacterized protein n=1 Tax=Aspergillus stella-maris TaxID=1810926 RepID=UPI003CCD2536
MDRERPNSIDYNQVLTQISSNLANALETFGPSSTQYQTVLDMLKDYMQEIDSLQSERRQRLDPDTLSLALGFLDIGK